MEIDGLLLRVEDNTKNFNTVKELVLDRLKIDGVITEDQNKTYAEKWNIIVIKGSWFKRWINAFSKDEDWIIKFVKFDD